MKESTEHQLIELLSNLNRSAERIADAMEKIVWMAGEEAGADMPEKEVDMNGPVDRAGRPMRYTDGTPIPIEEREDTCHHEWQADALNQLTVCLRCGTTLGDDE